MKNRSFRIITLALAALLLIGGIVGISVAAEDAAAPTVEIARKNISYEGAIKILYAIDAQNVAEDQTVKVYFYDTADTDAEPAYVKGLDEDDFITFNEGQENEITYPIVFSEGFSPKNMRKSVFAKPVVENAEGEVIVEGDVLEYSIWQYAINQFSKDSITIEQRTLYVSLLEYGAALQKLLLGTDSYTEEDLAAAGGYANEYYVLNLVATLDGVETPKTTRYTFSKEDILTSSLSAAEFNVDKIYNGAVFCGFTDKEGNAITEYGEANTASSWNHFADRIKNVCTKIGVSTIYANYNSAATVNDFSNGLGNVTVSNSKKNISIPEGEEYLYFNKTSGSGDSIIFNNDVEVNPDAKNKYVFEADMTWYGYTSDAMKNDWFMKFGFESDASAKVGGDHFIARYIFKTDASGNLQMRGDTNCTDVKQTFFVTIEPGRSFNFRVEYIPTGTNADGLFTHTVKLFIDGQLIRSYENGTTLNANYDNTTFNSVGFLARGSSHTAACAFSLDNVILAVESYE